MKKNHPKSPLPQNYFSQANTWADDLYTTTISRLYRYKLAFYCSFAAISLLALAIGMMMPLEKTDVIVVHQSDNGVVWVEPAKQPYAPQNRAQVESELINYVTNRESYSQYSFHTQYALINIMSAPPIAREYDQLQSSSNSQSPINLLGNNAEKIVHVDNVVFLDKVNLTAKNASNNSSNLAQVNFTVMVKNNNGISETPLPFTALISWNYRGTPDNPEIRWENWDGFTVTHYAVQQRNIKS